LGDTLNDIKSLKRPRCIKTHLPAFLLPKMLWHVKPKVGKFIFASNLLLLSTLFHRQQIVYVSRNPKDAAVSYYHHYKNLEGYKGTKADFMNAFLNDRILYSPFNEHVLGYWMQSKLNTNILMLFYEDMRKNLRTEVMKVMKFLNKIYAPNDIDKLCQHLSFDAMKNNPACNFETALIEIKKSNNVSEDYNFIRKGKIGSYQDEFDTTLDERFNQYVASSQLKHEGFAYKFS
jgi:hypothetical protein